jgi:adenine-specific DNA glycosylase
VTPQQRKIPVIVKDLLAWYLKNARDLPWRRTRDPYAIWVSEIILYHMVKQVLSFVVNLCANHDSPVISVS